MSTLTEEQVIAKLRTVFDPELNVNIVDLGLVYGIEIKESVVEVTMTLTTRGCPMVDAISSGVQHALNAEANVQSTKVNIVWDPPWSPEKMSEAAKEQLGFF